MTDDEYPPEIRDLLRFRQAEIDRLRAEVADLVRERDGLLDRTAP